MAGTCVTEGRKQRQDRVEQERELYILIKLYIYMCVSCKDILLHIFAHVIQTCVHTYMYIHGFGYGVQISGVTNEWPFWRCLKQS